MGGGTVFHNYRIWTLKLQFNTTAVKSVFADLLGSVISERNWLFYKWPLPFAPELLSFFVIPNRINIGVLTKLTYKIFYYLY